MFCEGYYLHRLLANTFEEERSLTFILSIGWGKCLQQQAVQIYNIRYSSSIVNLCQGVSKTTSTFFFYKNGLYIFTNVSQQSKGP
jgi:hypothetical protein